MNLPKNIRSNKLYVIISLGLVIFIFLTLFFSLHVFEGWQLKLSDTLFTEKQPLNSMIIIGIDDKSLQEIGRWPWPREKFIEILKILDKSTVVGFDVAMFEPYNKAVDTKLGELMRNINNTIIPIEFTSFKKNKNSIIGEKILTPIEELFEVETGFVNIFTDDDAVTRFIPLVIGDKKSFSLKISEKAVGTISYPSEIIRINYIGKPGSFEYISFTDALNSLDDKNIFDNKIVLIGATAPDLHDDSFVPTSAGTAMSGVEIQANVIQTLLTKNFLVDQPKYLVMVSILFFSLLITGLVILLHLRWASILSLALFIGYLILAFLTFKQGIILNIIYPPLTILASYTVAVSYSYVSEGKEKRKALKTLRQYVSREVIHEILENPDKLKLGGEKKDITVMFSDIRGFTSFSEKLKPEKLVGFLNEYLTEMSEIILDDKGVIDKYIGDAIMAFWGAPLENKHHSRDACRSALKMIDKLKEIQQNFKKRNLPEINIGIGLNSGEAVIGNMGSSKRFDYTAMGDTVNISSRLESLTKQYNVKIIISQTTYREINEEFVCRELDFVNVKGKNKPIKIYELVGEKDKVSKKTLDAIADFEKGLSLYRKQQWDKAIKQFECCPEETAKIFIDRCKFLKKDPPEESWLGVWQWKIK